MKKYKFIHIFLHNSVWFNKLVIDMILEDSKRFCSREHIFVTVCEELYNIYQDKCHMLFADMKGADELSIINAYGNLGEWIIVHSMPGLWWANCTINEELLPRIVWRTWGHDLTLGRYYPDLKSVIFHLRWIIHGDYKLIIKDFKNSRTYRRKMKDIVCRFRAVGLGDSIDSVILGKYVPPEKQYILPYAEKDAYSIVLNNENNESEDGYYHVMVGHSGLGDNHIKLTQLLKKYENYPIMLHYILSYGDADYIQRVIDFIKENWHGAYDIILEGKPFHDYANYVSYMDAAILDGKGSYALGNLSMLAFYGKKLFLNKKGIISRFFVQNGISHVFTQNIRKMSFDEFISDIDGMVTQNEAYHAWKYSEVKDKWKKLFDDLLSEN